MRVQNFCTFAPRNMLFLCLGLLASYAPNLCAQPQADTWPNRPVRIVVGFPAGSFIDTIARALSTHLSQSLGQPVIVDNKPGANGAIGASEVAHAPPDGYTLLITNSSSITINPQIYKKITYKITDFSPVTMVLEANFILTVNPAWAQKHHINTVQDVVTFAKNNPWKLSYGSAGPGNIAHLTYVAWSNRTDIKTTHVPYKSATQAQQAVFSGEIDTQFDTWSALPHIAGGKLLALAVTAPKRMPQLPQVPTMAEAGFDDFHVTFWAGVLAPAGTPPAIVNKIFEASKGALNDARIHAVLSSQGEPLMLPPTQFGQRITKEATEWGQVIQRESFSLD